eukprot:TRINITY_DN2883_c0_g1_i6.p2 TRINITY_DN2883_c0_g1~~TRINITY_DN2883_c0_g1_i6.p2  ORF type:complete len:182 (-),score=22.15 TRINITY_DN2883_c0_g1_i6:101-646(-)
MYSFLLSQSLAEAAIPKTICFKSVLLLGGSAKVLFLLKGSDIASFEDESEDEENEDEENEDEETFEQSFALHCIHGFQHWLCRIVKKIAYVRYVAKISPTIHLKTVLSFSPGTSDPAARFRIPIIWFQSSTFPISLCLFFFMPIIRWHAGFGNCVLCRNYEITQTRALETFLLAQALIDVE